MGASGDIGYRDLVKQWRAIIAGEALRELGVESGKLWGAGGLRASRGSCGARLCSLSGCPFVAALVWSNL